MNGILGKKLGMTSVFDDKGNTIPCTVIEAGPCYVTQIKTKLRDGYDAVQLGFEEKKMKRSTKAEIGHAAKANVAPPRFISEFRLSETNGLSLGSKVTVEIFKKGEKVKVTGTSKGKGFQGVVRRHHFRGGPASHGQSDRLRAPGSIGSSSFPSRVFKGQRMAGHMGNARVTVRNLTVIDVVPESNLLLVKGAVPGAINGYVKVQKVS
ncbi:MAG: 50S ribosomal protein L3 [Bacteroidota bacterium]